MSESGPHPKKKSRSQKIHPFLTPEERLAVWRNLRGMLNGRKPSPLKELKKIRSEWDRELPPFRS
jgi:hypothetical protein